MTRRSSRWPPAWSWRARWRGVAGCRRWPVVAALIGLVGYVLATHDPNLASPPVAVVLTFYTLGRSGAARRAFCGSSCWRVSDSRRSGPFRPAQGVLGERCVVLAGHGDGPARGGGAARPPEPLSRQLADAAEQLRAEQDHNAAQATAEERNRVARDLHDVVAHCVSVMVVQAGAARLVAAHELNRRGPGAGGHRRLWARRDGRPSSHRRGPAPPDDPGFGRGAGLGDLGLLTERIRAAGVPTRLHILGSPNSAAGG